MKRFTIVSQIDNGEKLEELTQHISKALKEFEEVHGVLAEADIQVAIMPPQEQPPIFTDARSIGFMPPSGEYYDDEDE